VDEPGGASYYGSIAATPYAKMIFEKIIKYKNYEPTTDIEEDLNKLNHKVKMPDVVGKDVYSAINLIESLGLQFEVQGEVGEIVYSQFPSPGTDVSKNSVVMIDINK